MKNSEISEQLLDGITADDARAVKQRLEAHGLTQKWLLQRLKIDYGIDISFSNLSDLFNYRWSVGKNGRKIIYCAREILERYESVFSK